MKTIPLLMTSLVACAASGPRRADPAPAATDAPPPAAAATPARLDACPPDGQETTFPDPGLRRLTTWLCDPAAHEGYEELAGFGDAALEPAWPLLWHLVTHMRPGSGRDLLEQGLWNAGPGTQGYVRERCAAAGEAERARCADVLDTFEALDIHNAPGADY